MLMIESLSLDQQFLGPNLISWWSRKQHVITRSNTETEYHSLAQSFAEILWIQALLKELSISFSTLDMLCDNHSAVAIAHNLVFHSRTKHMEIDLFVFTIKCCPNNLLFIMFLVWISGSMFLLSLFLLFIFSLSSANSMCKILFLQIPHLEFEGGGY